MAESILYMAADLQELEAILQGRDRSVAAALAVLRNALGDPVAIACLDELLEGRVLAWDEPPLRECGWQTFSELSGFFAGFFRLFGKELAFDVWQDGLRLQFLLGDWSPLARGDLLHVTCRPIPPLLMRHIDPEDSDACVPFLESYPHGFVTREELPALLERLHALLGALHATLSHEPTPRFLAMQSPGFAPSAAEVLEMTLTNDGTFEGWQCARAAILYRAACEAHRMKRDLICVGY